MNEENYDIFENGIFNPIAPYGYNYLTGNVDKHKLIKKGKYFQDIQIYRKNG